MNDLEIYVWDRQRSGHGISVTYDEDVVTVYKIEIGNDSKNKITFSTDIIDGVIEAFQHLKKEVEYNE